MQERAKSVKLLLLTIGKCAKVSESNVNGLTRFHSVPAFVKILDPDVILRDGANVDAESHVSGTDGRSTSFN